MLMQNVGGTNKEYYGILQNGPLVTTLNQPIWSIVYFHAKIGLKIGPVFEFGRWTCKNVENCMCEKIIMFLSISRLFCGVPVAQTLLDFRLFFINFEVG